MHAQLATLRHIPTIRKQRWQEFSFGSHRPGQRSNSGMATASLLLTTADVLSSGRCARQLDQLYRAGEATGLAQAGTKVPRLQATHAGTQLARKTMTGCACNNWKTPTNKPWDLARVARPCCLQPCSQSSLLDAQKVRTRCTWHRVSQALGGI